MSAITEDATPFQFDESGRKKFKEALGNFVMAIKTFQEQEEKGEMTLGFKNTLAYCLETYCQEITCSMGIEGMIKQMRDDSNKEIRSVNQENRALRAMLGNKVTNEDLRERIKNIDDEFSRWWNTEGLGFSQDITFRKYHGLSAKLSGHISEDYYNEATEKEAKDRAAEFSSKGFDIVSDSPNSFYAGMTENNIRLIEGMLKSKYASAKILRIESSYYRGLHKIRDIEITISDLNDFDEKVNDDPVGAEA
jgi:hypothetical protein